jgi:hypothetical protein
MSSDLAQTGCVVETLRYGTFSLIPAVKAIQAAQLVDRLR